MTQEEETALANLAAELGVKADSLRRLIEFESRWNPLAKNPTSSARGLIQFMDATARDMGYLSSLDLVQKHPTIISQLKGPVRRYLIKYKPFKTDQSLFMAVFYPRARDWPENKLFPDSVRKANPNINTPKDYLSYVARRTKSLFPDLTKNPEIGLGIVTLAIIFIISKQIFKG